MDPIHSSLRTLFEAALRMPADVRTAFLFERCPDPEQRAKIQRMLDADSDTGDAVPATPAAALAGAIGEPDTTRAFPPGSRIGSFELIEVLGEGGSSTVFRAVREVDGVRQEVALKLLRHGLYSRDAQRQFRHERLALTQLRHPNIARLIEGGVTENAVAYIALDLVVGRRITDYVCEQRLDVSARLMLFLQVCRAVEAAHRALIVHRDLKPSNVLVGDDGQVKLLDFGVAKLLDTDDEHTQTRFAAFTPAYAAPEQLSGAPITTATDVYALGVLLGELMTGQRLNDGSRRTPSGQVADDTAAGVLPAPPRITRRQLRGDLDNIVLKALDAEPERRYASAGMLAQDIERYLAGRPVAAHPPSRWYRTQKFIQRHRGGVAISAAFLLAILAALAIALWEANIARHEARRANSVRDFVEQLFDSVREGVAENKLPSIRDLVAAGVKRLDATTGLGPAERVDLTLMFARLRDNLGDRPGAIELADSAYKLASSSLDTLDPLTIDALNLRGSVAVDSGDFAAGEPALIETQRRLRAAGIGGKPLIDVLDTLAWVAMERDRGEAALALERTALDERVRAFGANAKETAAGYNNLGYGLEGAGQFDAAVDAYQRAYEVDLKYREPDSYDVLGDLANLGATLLRAGHLKRARELLAQAQDGLNHLGGKPRSMHVLNAQKLCIVDTLVFDLAAAQRSCAQMQQITGDLAGVTDATRGDSMRQEAFLLIESGQLAPARLALDSAWTLYPDTPENVSRRGMVLRSRAEITWLLGDAAATRDDALAARPLLATLADYPVTLGLDGLLWLACVHAPAPACPPNLESDLHVKLAHYASDNHPRLLAPRLAEARGMLEHGDAQAALAMIETGIAGARSELGDSHPMILTAKLWRAIALDTLGRCAQSRQQSTDVENAATSAGTVNYPWLTEARSALAHARRCPGVLR